MGASTSKRALRFCQGEVGFVIYEETDPTFMATGRVTPLVERTYAFGTIGDAAAWLVNRYTGSDTKTASPE